MEQEIILHVLGDRRLHCDQTVEEEAKGIKRYMVLSVNTHDRHEHWIDGFGETIEEALGIALGGDPEWELVAIYDLRSELLGTVVEVEIKRGLRAVMDGEIIGELWED